MTTPNQPTNLTTYIKSPAIISKFAEVIGDNNARPYIQSVIIAVSNSPELLKCSHESITRSALRAASLGLSCDPALKQAWIVPYWNGKKKVMEAQFQPHYRGLYTLAMRTGKYWQINVSPVYEGQRVLENPLTGLHMIQEGDLISKPQGTNAAYVDVTVRRRKDLKVIGWLGYFKTKKGFEKSVWMSAQEIDDHARKYVRDYDKNPNWNDADKRPVMEMKTVLRQLLSWADLSGTENLQLVEALNADAAPQADDVIDALSEDVPHTDNIKPLEYDDAEKMIVTIKGKGERFLTELDAQSLNDLYIAPTTSDELRTLIAIVLKNDHGMDAPQVEPRGKEQNMKELGF